MTRVKVVAAAAVIAAGVAFLSGCATPIPTETTSVLGGNSILTADLATDVTAEGVVRAAVLLVAGDIKSAIKRGTVTEGEVASARQAIADGTLDMWRQRAESDGGITR